jgi:ComF family protein
VAVDSFRSLLLSSGLLLTLALDAVFPPRDAEKLVREARVEDVLALAAPVRTRLGAIETVSIARFRTPLMRSLVHEAKYRGNEKAQRLLAALLALYIDKEAPGPAVLVPIPLSKTRFRERGFNQCEVIARLALSRGNSDAAQVSLAAEVLARIRDTEHQTALTRAGRRANVAGAFEVPTSKRPSDAAHTYIVFDDVLTTGATLEAAASALREAGATDIRALTLAN